MGGRPGLELLQSRKSSCSGLGSSGAGVGPGGSAVGIECVEVLAGDELAAVDARLNGPQTPQRPHCQRSNRSSSGHADMQHVAGQK